MTMVEAASSRLFFGMGSMGVSVMIGSLCAAQGPSVSVEFPEQVHALGDTAKRLEQAQARLCAPPLDDLDFVLSDVHFTFTRRFTEYSGDISGRLLGALNAAGPVLGCDAPMLPTLMQALPQYQQPDGHFGAEQDLATDINQQRDMPILWGNGRLLLAMAQCVQRAPDERLLEAATRLGKYVLATRPYYGKEENFRKVGGAYASGFTTCYPSLTDGLAALAEVTGEERFAEEGRFIARLALLDTEFKKHHSHGRLVTYTGMLELDRLAGANEFRDAVVQGCARITKHMLLPTGGVTEMFDRDYPRDEGCSEADWIRVNLLLWRATGDTTCLDMAEHALRNHLLATQFPNGGFGHNTFTPLRNSGRSFLAGRLEGECSDSYWCCSMHATQILADLARWGVLGVEDAVLITWLAEVRAKLQCVGQEIAITTQRLSPVRWRVQLEGGTNAPITLRLRVPAWAKTIQVDGSALTAQNGWAEIAGAGADKRVLDVLFPDAIRLAGPYDDAAEDNEPVRVFAGPDLFCLPQPYLALEGLAANAVPTLVLAAARPRDGKIPVLVANDSEQYQQALLDPMATHVRGACRFLFNVNRVSAERFAELGADAMPMRHPGELAELLFACDETYEVYLNGAKVFQHRGWGESPRVPVYTGQPMNVVAVKTPAQINYPGLIGLVLVGGRTYVTRPEDWSAMFCAEQPSREALAAPPDAPTEAGKPADLGGFGAAPWRHVPAHFAGTPARWIWPTRETAEGEPVCCLFRYTFEIPGALGTSPAP